MPSDSRPDHLPITVAPERTLAIICGASEWPEYPGFQRRASFKNSAFGFQHYLVGSDGFCLPAHNLLNLFDSPGPPSEIDREVTQFLYSRIAESRNSGTPISDILFYYVGHGGFTGPARDYFLALAATRKGSEGTTGLRVVDLAASFGKSARHLRRYVILDACFSAQAISAFQSSAASLAESRLKQAFFTPPSKGALVLCSSNSSDVSIAPENEAYTAFSGALLEALRNGDPKSSAILSFEQIRDLVDHIIEQKYNNTPRPEIHSPDQRQGDIRHVPFFPNSALQLSYALRTISTLSMRVQALEKTVIELKNILSQQASPPSSLADQSKPTPATPSQSEGQQARTPPSSQTGLLGHFATELSKPESMAPTQPEQQGERTHLPSHFNIRDGSIADTSKHESAAPPQSEKAGTPSERITLPYTPHARDVPQRDTDRNAMSIEDRVQDAAEIPKAPRLPELSIDDLLPVLKPVPAEHGKRTTPEDSAKERRRRANSVRDEIRKIIRSECERAKLFGEFQITTRHGIIGDCGFDLTFERQVGPLPLEFKIAFDVALTHPSSPNTMTLYAVATGCTMDLRSIEVSLQDFSQIYAGKWLPHKVRDITKSYLSLLAKSIEEGSTARQQGNYWIYDIKLE